MKKKASRFFLLPLMVLLVSVVVFALPSGNALAATTVGGAMPQFGSEASAVTNGKLTSHGGPVMDGTSYAYLIFWEPSGFPVTPNYNQLLVNWFQDVGGSGLYNNNKQYTSKGGKAPKTQVLAAAVLDQRPYATNPMTDTEVRAEIAFVMSVEHWQASIHNIFYVFTGAGEHNVIGDQGACAYHTFFGTDTIYAAIMYPGLFVGCLAPLPSPNNDQVADSAINSASHEQMEAVTDPLLNAWYHVDLSHEIADQCAWNFGKRNSTGANVTYKGHPYLVQKEWDNKKSGCVLSGP